MTLLLLLLFIGLMLYFTIHFAAIIAVMVAVALGSITVTVLAIVWLTTSRSLKQMGYNRYSAHMTYRQVKSDLSQISEDLNEIRSQLQEAAPRLQEMEFLKYSRREDSARRKTS